MSGGVWFSLVPFCGLLWWFDCLVFLVFLASFGWICLMFCGLVVFGFSGVLLLACLVCLLVW